MSSILVTGGAGMIGSNLVKAFVKQGHRVRVVDNLWRGKKDNLLDDRGRPVIDFDRDFFEYDLSVPVSDPAFMRGVDYVVHLADIVAGINFVFSNQQTIFRQNILINSNTIEMVRKTGVKGFLYIGTACSFPASRQNTFDPPPLREEELYPAEPESAYGWSKLMGQYETELLEKESGIPCGTIMFHNVYGTPTDYDERRSQVIPSLIRKAIVYPEEPFIVWGSGEQSRAFLHVDDAVRAIVLTLEKGMGKGVIQIGPSRSTAIREIAGKVVEISGKDIEIRYDRTKPEGDKARSADFSKARKLLGWEPTVSIDEGLRKVYEWIDARVRGHQLRGKTMSGT